MKLVPIDPTETHESRETKISPAVGEWYWTTTEDYSGKKSRWLGCITHVGSNYFEVTGVSDGSVRVHADEFAATCEREPDAEKHIKQNIAAHAAETHRLMEKVIELTRRLAVSPDRALENEQSETAALVLHSKTASMKDYKKALVKAKKDTLPDLFKKIEESNKAASMWMKAELIPLKAQANGMRGLLSAVEDRIFNVELYAGLVEEVALVRDGAPAHIGERVRLMQRRHYMDEECLANYETGGMEFKNIRAFDKWLARDDNFTRIFPHARCVVAFQVRRMEKEREAHTLLEIIQVLRDGEADKLTFLYMRNGDKLYRLSTEIVFDEKLFPDMEREALRGVLYGKKNSHSREEVITEAEYLGMVEDEEREEAERLAKLATASEKDKWRYEHSAWIHSDQYVRFDPATVFFDDIAEAVAGKIKHHNRIGLILQGLLDRSPVFHPHPPWSLYTPDGFASAIELVYDDSRALAPAELPDFEAYRARLNTSIKVGSITIGQEDAWQRAEAVKEHARRGRSYRYDRHDRTLERFTPYGNPGPGLFAKVTAVGRTGKVTYAWQRARQTYDRWNSRKGPINTSFTCDRGLVLCVDAYKPGDYKIFYADPRTRMEYLKWAPLLLEAEEWHAGNRKR